MIDSLLARLGIELEDPAELFARIGYGNWNDCPEPHFHTALQAYCSDIVEQGARTTAKLASSLRAAKYWYFWWG